MPTVHLVPVKRGMDPDEVVGRLQGGWRLLGRQAVRRGQAIATPGCPEGHTLEDADVWMLDEPMIPQAMVAKLILDAATEYMAGDALNAVDPLECLCQDLYGMDIDALRSAFEGATSAQEQHPSKD